MQFRCKQHFFQQFHIQNIIVHKVQRAQHRYVIFKNLQFLYFNCNKYVFAESPDASGSEVSSVRSSPRISSQGDRSDADSIAPSDSVSQIDINEGIPCVAYNFIILLTYFCQFWRFGRVRTRW